jgi:DNA-binding transcriptional regulator PaaX
LGNWLMDYAGYSHRTSSARLIRQLQRQQVVRSARTGRELNFSITEKGRALLNESDPQQGWQRLWDGNWHALTFDVPESRRKDRLTLWRALRARKLGFLQRSIWVWPHDLRRAVKEMIRVEGLPECFFGFTTRSIWLCNDAEIVASSWNWEEIGRRHQSYLSQCRSLQRALETASSLENAAQTARVERTAYVRAFSLDPLLPQKLLPSAYAGRKVQDAHVAFKRLVALRLAQLSSERAKQ